MISFLICTYNREQYISICLEALATQNSPASEFEIVIVNNNSSDSTHDICTAFQNNHHALNITYVIEKAQGLSFARNRALHESKGDVVIYLDDDAFACPNYVSAIIEFMSRHPEAKSFGGKTLPQWETKEPKWMNPYLIPMLAVVDRGDADGTFTGKAFPIGANMGFKKSLFEEIGEFNVNLGRVGKNLASGEEKDIFDRIRRLGYPIHYISKAQVNHIIPESRLEEAFVRRQAISIGHSERERTKMIGFGSWMRRIISEGIKWAATLVLSVYYTFTFKAAKARMLIWFRIWVSGGLFNLLKPE